MPGKSVFDYLRRSFGDRNGRAEINRIWVVGAAGTLKDRNLRRWHAVRRGRILDNWNKTNCPSRGPTDFSNFETGMRSFVLQQAAGRSLLCLARKNYRQMLFHALPPGCSHQRRPTPDTRPPERVLSVHCPSRIWFGRAEDLCRLAAKHPPPTILAYLLSFPSE